MYGHRSLGHAPGRPLTMLLANLILSTVVEMYHYVDFNERLGFISWEEYDVSMSFRAGYISSVKSQIRRIFLSVTKSDTCPPSPLQQLDSD